ncbi:MAG: serine/threonine-protein kinase [Planctomycetales bacterium]|nr:serine/threonine-protein kinase [Planctomycetales bacterium]
MNIPPAESVPEDQPKAAMRYTYPSGSRPLEGYTIKRGVGRGGFGEVYFSVSDAGKEVALKLIRRNMEVELRGVTQCLNLKHHNLIALYDIRTDELEDRWVVMEYVSGESLDEVIERHPQGMPLELVLHWFTGIATGVAYLHDHGIVHRDLKPANIFLDEGVVKIGDYGLSKFISCSRRSGQTESVGTVHYMAPEIANGRYGKEIDTYALGIILYEMLTGHVPFEGESVGEVLMKHLTAEPDLSALEEPFRGIVRGAMAKDPELRIKSVSEILDRLPSSGKTTTAPRVDTNGQRRIGEPTVAATAHSAAPWPADQVASDASQPRSSVGDEEPILASIRGAWHDAEHRFRKSNLHPVFKIAIAIALVLGLLVSSELLIAVLIPTALVYLFYRAVRAVVMAPDRPQGAVRPARVAAQPLPGTPAVPPAMRGPSQVETVQYKPNHKPRRFHRQSWRRQLQDHLAAKTMRERVTELVGSMLVAAVVSAVASLLVCLIVVRGISTELCVWMSLVATLASWAVMVPARLTEGKIEDQAPLRFAQLVLGALVGATAWGIGKVLLVQTPVSRDMGIRPSESLMENLLGLSKGGELQDAFNLGFVELSLQSYAAYFAFLFVLIAWWRQAEATRSVRVSLWSIAWCAFVAWLLHLVWWFPQPIGMLLAAVIAFTVQLSSTWLPPSRRKALVEQEV